MLKRILEMATQLVCITALALVIVEREGEGGKKKLETLEAVHEFEGRWFSSKPDTPRWLISILSSDTVLNWLMDRIIITAKQEGFFEGPSKNS
jgi:hypothetical protein